MSTRSLAILSHVGSGSVLLDPHDATRLTSGVPAPIRDNPNLDFLRAWAVLCVLVAHLLMFFQLSIGPVGTWGVSIFFVHTTLVLMFSLQRLQHERQVGQPVMHFRAFIVRRAFRIFPLATVTTLLIFVMQAPLEFRGGRFVWAGVDAWGLVANVLLIQDVALVPSIQSPLWSLPVEVQMYVLLPALFYVVGRARAPLRLVLGLWAIAAIVALLAPGAVRLRALLPHVPWQLVIAAPCFLAGIVAYTIHARRRVPAFWWPVLVVALSAAFLMTAPWRTQSLACLVLGLAIPRFHVLSSTWLVSASRVVARYSYGVYLTHLFALWFALDYGASAGLPMLARWCLFIVLVAGLPVVLYHGLEAPLIRVGVRFARPRAERLMAAHHDRTAFPRQRAHQMEKKAHAGM